MTEPKNSSVTSSASTTLDGNHELDFAVEVVLNHLRNESEYLDAVIQCSLKMKDVLRERQLPGEPAKNEDDAGPATIAFPGTNRNVVAPHDTLTTMRGDLERRFLPILEGRQQMKSALLGFKPLIDDPFSVTSLAPKLNEPARGELKRLRNTIRDKLHEIRAITMGNQAVLMYTMDFYQRLLGGLSNETPSAKAYNADGKLTTQAGSGMLQKNC